MISGNMEEIEKILPSLGGNLKKAFELIKDIDFSSYADGKYPLDGDNIFAGVNTYMTEPEELRRWEKHAKYIDIQIIGKGEEKIGYASHREEFPVTEDRLEKDDVAFFANVPEDNFITLKQNEWAVLFPWEDHKPNCQSGKNPSEVQKIVVKVRA